ncbi:tyrosine-type recombinase/integrase [Pseudomonas sp. URMO17WK12:I12]|uniref:tyrosine-type recombinase/integrase n=1 Tax=Pseudomonas sp. URMO17WK12:I12 TaxID=1259797 RepID=UPI00210BDFD5|nr:tyrosine-type recombinase/integrase [Pseudomonas sp. URMO17WK12:I12]
MRDCASGHQLKTAFMLMIYMASSPGEVRHAKWSEIDLDVVTWTTPAAKMKMRRDHSVPMSRQAIDLLKRVLPITGGQRYVSGTAIS